MMNFLIIIAFFLCLTPISHSFFSDDLESIRKSAEQGNAEAQYVLGFHYVCGIGGVEKDYKEAIKWFAKSAEQGNAMGQYWLGLSYYHGYGVPKD